MHEKQVGLHTYRLVLLEDGRGCARTIEFEASGAEAALLLAAKECAGREVELFEESKSLGRLKHNADSGFWVILPADKAGPTGDGFRA